MKILTWLSRRRFPYEPLITVEISKSRLIHNLDEFRKIAPEGRVAPVLKSNAYGHGLFEVAEILEKGGGRKEGGEATPYTLHPIPFFVIDSYFEAVALRSRGFKTPLLIVGYTRPETIINSSLKRVAFTVTNMETLRSLKSKHPLKIHLKIDTGMHRQGILSEEIDEAIELIKADPNIVIKGICSHMPDADNSDQTFTKDQISSWNGLVGRFRKAFPFIKYVHLSNTDGHRFTKGISANLSRLGLGLYGLANGGSFSPKLELEPVMEMRTILTGVKKLHEGYAVGYSNTFKAKKEMTIATVPAGYFEGIDRRLSSNPDGSPNGFVLVGPGRIACPIVGRVSMNITTIDVSAVPDAHIGMEAVMIGKNATDANSMISIARKCGTIAYEIAVLVPAHLRRVVTE